MTPQWMSRLVAATLTAVLASAATGCTTSNGHGKEEPLETKTEAAATELVKRQAQATADLVGAPLENWSTTAAPCEGSGGEVVEDGRWNLSGHAQIPVAEEQQIATLQRLHAEWTHQGYDVRPLHSLPPNGQRGRLTGRSPGDRLSITVGSTTPPTAFSLIVVTPCYMPADGESPGR